jgi:hypothetical protein
MFSRLQYVILAVIIFMANTCSVDAYAIPTRRQFFHTSAVVAADTVLLPQTETTVMVSHAKDRLLDVLLDKLVETIFDDDN